MYYTSANLNTIKEDDGISCRSVIKEMHSSLDGCVKKQE